MTRRPIVWLHSGEREPETDLWDPATAEWVERPSGSFAAGIAYGLVTLVAGILLGLWLAGRVVAAPRTALLPETDAGQLGALQATLPGQRGEPDGQAAPAQPAVGSAPPPLDAIRTGIASWYATSGPGIYAAAGPALRVGHWRGRVVTVCAGTCLSVRLSDWCACRGRLIDLSSDAFRRLAPLSQGLVRVSVTWGGPTATPPPTDSQP